MLDPFGGSGSTLIACQQTGRICFTMELDEKYADVIVKRYLDFVGTADQVFLLRGGEKINFCEVASKQGQEVPSDGNKPQN